jgi:unspecific monooxygenase
MERHYGEADLVGQLLRNEDLFRKSGNHEEILGSVLADFLGENIISAYGDKWKPFRGVVKPGLRRGFNRTILDRNNRRLVELISAGVARE